MIMPMISGGVGGIDAGVFALSSQVLRSRW